MKIVSFNINSVRARIHQVEAIIDRHQPEVIGLQETKVHDEEFPIAAIQEMGYESYFFGQKSHYGVALLTKISPDSVENGFPDDAEDSQKRFITGKFQLGTDDLITVMNGYFPQGENRSHEIKFPAKVAFYENLQAQLEHRYEPLDSLVVMGDFNISPQDIDIGIGDKNRKRWLQTGKCSFLPEEREWYQRLLGWGLTDSFRQLHPQVADRFSWFDYRSRGFEDTPKRGLRIDQILVTEPLISRITDCGIDYEIRAMEKPSDHCPIWVQLD